MNRRIPLTALVLAATLLLGPAQAQTTKLKWAHGYETSEAFHRMAVSVAEDIKKRTNGRYDIAVFPASSLGKESDANLGVQTGTVDITTTGAAFASRVRGPYAIEVDAPYRVTAGEEEVQQDADAVDVRLDRRPAGAREQLRCEVQGRAG